MASQYCTQTDMQNRFGVMNIITWSNLDNTNANPDTNRIAAAINWAGDYIDNRVRRSKYALPLSSNSGGALYQLVDWAAVLASWWLYTSRGMRDVEGDPKGAKLEALKQQAEREIDQLLAGQIEFDAQLGEPIGPTGPVIT